MCSWYKNELESLVRTFRIKPDTFTNDLYYQLLNTERYDWENDIKIKKLN